LPSQQPPEPSSGMLNIRLRSSLVVVALMFLVGCASGEATPSSSSLPSAATSVAQPDRPVPPGQLAEGVDAWKKQLEDVAKTQGLTAAWAKLDDILKTSPAAASDCHSLMRHVGYVLVGSVGLVSPMDQRCDFGFVHGQLYGLAEISKSLEDFAKTVVPYCTSAPSNLSEAAVCFHGMGHGFAITSNNDITRALDKCNELGVPSSDQCFGAVLMEFGEDRLSVLGWPSGHSSENSPKVLSVENKDIASLCDGRTSACYYRLWMYHAPLRDDSNPPDEAAIAEKICIRGISGEDLRMCLAGFGEFAANLWIVYDLNFNYPPDTAAEADAAAKAGVFRCSRHPDQATCLFGLISSTVGNLYNADWPHIPDFCANVPPDLESACKHSVATAIQGGDEDSVN
jgi:hypothetical protein